MDAVGRKEVEPRPVPQERVGLGHPDGRQCGAVAPDPADVAGGGNVEGLRNAVQVDPAADVHAVQRGRFQHGLRPFGGQAADFAPALLLVFQQHQPRRQRVGIEVVQQQPAAVQRQRPHRPLPVHHMPAPETERPQTAVRSATEGEDVFLFPFQIGCELESVVAHEAAQCADPDAALRILPDVLGEHLRQSVLRGVVAAGVFRGDGGFCGGRGTVRRQESQRGEHAKQNMALRIHAGFGRQ